MLPVKIYADDSGKETQFGNLSAKQQQSFTTSFQKMNAALASGEPVNWADLELAFGEIIAASTSTVGGRVILFPSTGDEEWDTAIAKRNGIENPVFSPAEGVLRGHYNDGVMIFKDEGEKIAPPPGDTHPLQMGVDY